jgi:hypothetical protein
LRCVPFYARYFRSVSRPFILGSSVLHRFGGIRAGLRLLLRSGSDAVSHRCRLLLKCRECAFDNDILRFGSLSAVRNLLLHQAKLANYYDRADDASNYKESVERHLKELKKLEAKHANVAIVAFLFFGSALMVGWFFWLVLWGSGRINSSGWWGVRWFLVAVVLVAHGAQILVNAL